MNTRVVFSLVLAATWLAGAAYCFFFAPPEMAFGNAQLFGWVCVLLALWNVLRTLMVWSKPKRDHGRPF
jgi:hypothetical protein